MGARGDERNENKQDKAYERFERLSQGLQRHEERAIRSVALPIEAVSLPPSIFHKPAAVAVPMIVTIQARNPSIHLYRNRRHGDF
jgi:hypothetical protein